MMRIHTYIYKASKIVKTFILKVLHHFTYSMGEIKICQILYKISEISGSNGM